MAAVGSEQDPLQVQVERTVTLGPTPDIVQLTVTGGGLRAQSFDPSQTAQAILKLIVYPDMATANADAGSLTGAGSAFFGAATLLGGSGSLVATQGFSLADFALQLLGDGLYTATPVLGLTKVVLVPDANAAVVSTVGDPKVSEGTESTTGVASPVARSGMWLGPASPNPARGPARIRFAIPSSDHVSLAIFDPQGRRVRSLLDGSMAAGEHEVIWDGNDAEGRKPATGLYFYRLRTSDRSLSGSIFSIR
jgi:hypothetical protein